MITEFPSLWNDINPRLAHLAEEAEELRNAPGESHEGETPAALHSKLIRSRQAQDRLEAIVADVARIRSRARIFTSQLEENYEDAWRTTMQNTRVGEYTSAKERDANYTAGAVQELVAWRRAKRLLADVEEVYDYIYFKYRGLDTARREIESRVRILNVQGMLES